MSAGHNDPRVLLTIANINAYHIQEGDESSLTPSGPQTLSLLMVPTSSPFADLSNADPSSAAPEEDFYLHLHLPPELDISLPATTQIFHQLPRSYLIPRWDLGLESGAFTRIEFPKLGSGPGRVTQEEIDTFETILAQCTAFLERANPPFAGAGKDYKDVKGYNPGSYAAGEGYIGHSAGRGQIVLIDEEDGSVVGELSEGFDVVADSKVMPGSKNPVEVTLPQEGQGNRITVANISEDYLNMSKHPAYANSTIVQNAATASRLIVTGTGYLANTINSGATAFTQKTKPNPKPMTFSPTTQERIRKLNNLTHGAVGLSAATVGQVGRLAQGLGATLSKRKANNAGAGKGERANAPGYKPGVLNKSMIAFSTIADGIEAGARQLLDSGSTAASTVVAHRYGPEAGQVARHVAGGVKNVGLVYVDATGVSRKAVLKSVAKGMVVGKVPGPKGQGDYNLVVGDGDGGIVPPEMVAANLSRGEKGGASSAQPGYGVGMGGSEKPGEGVGEPLEGSTAAQGAYGFPADRKTG